LLKQLRETLAAARAVGLPFDDAWPAVAHRYIRDADVRDATADAWQRAYEGQPATPCEAAVATLAVLFERASVGDV
jgi:hypothetical protein